MFFAAKNPQHEEYMDNMQKNMGWSDTERDYIEYRLLQQIHHYSQSGKRLQMTYYAVSIANTAIMAAVPVITMLSDTITSMKYIIAAISALASILSSFLLIGKTKDNWIEYRATSELLQSEFAAFKARGLEYSSKNDQERFALLVERCEKITRSEQTGWHSRMRLEAEPEYSVSRTSEETGSH